MSLPELLPGTGYRTLIDSFTGTIVTSAIENIFSMLQVYLNNIQLFAVLGFGHTANATIVRMMRLIFEPPVLLSTIYLVEKAFVSDAGNATVFLPLLMFNSMSGYVTQTNILKNQFIEFIIGLEVMAQDTAPSLAQS